MKKEQVYHCVHETFLDECGKYFSRKISLKDIKNIFQTYVEHFGFSKGELNIFCDYLNKCFVFQYSSSQMRAKTISNSTREKCLSNIKPKENALFEHIEFEGDIMGYIYVPETELTDVDPKEITCAKMGLKCLAKLIVFYMFQRKFYETKAKYEIAFTGPANILKQLSKMMHDIKTPLAAVMAAADLVQSEMMGPLNNPQKKYIGIIKDSSRQLNVMLDDLMDLARIRLSSIELRIAPFSIKEIVNEVLNLFEGQILDKKLKVKTEFVGDEYVMGDQKRIKQVIYNIFSNAVKYTPPNGKMVLSVVSQDDGFRVTVEDSGPGIPEDIIDGLLNEKGGGALTTGLFIIKRLVEYHGGHIEIESKKGKGTKFSFFIPREIKLPSLQEQGNDNNEEDQI